MSSFCKLQNHITMQKSISSIDGTRRTLLALFSASLALSACASGSNKPIATLSEAEKLLKHKFRGIYGVVTRIDAANIKEYVSITTDKGAQIDGSGTLSPKNVSNSSYGGAFPIPLTIRATWKKGPVTMGNDIGWMGGTIIGDYTVPVAERIPDEVLDYIRQNGGALRLKIRLHDEGIFIGWDVEQRLPIRNWKAINGPQKYYIDYTLAGGDFQETRPANVVFEDSKPKNVPSSLPTPLSASDEAFLKRHDLELVEGTIVTNPPTPANHKRVWIKGWYIGKTGQKVFTDY